MTKTMLALALLTVTGCGSTVPSRDYHRGYREGRREAFIDALECSIDAESKRETRARIVRMLETESE